MINKIQVAKLTGLTLDFKKCLACNGSNIVFTNWNIFCKDCKNKELKKNYSTEDLRRLY